MANIIIPKNRIQVVNEHSDLSERGQSKRRFLERGLAGMVGGLVLACTPIKEAVSYISGLDAPGNVAYAQGPKKKSSANLQWKVYDPTHPERLTIIYNPTKERTISKDFLKWDMGGMKSPILESESDFPENLLKDCEESNLDPMVVVVELRYLGKYGSGAGMNYCNTRFNSNGTWQERIRNHWKQFSHDMVFNEVFRPPYDAKALCVIINEIKFIEDKKLYTQPWSKVWKFVDQKFQTGAKK